MKQIIRKAFNRLKDVVAGSRSYQYTSTKTEIRGDGHVNIERVKKTGPAAKKEVDRAIAETEKELRRFGI